MNRFFPKSLLAALCFLFIQCSGSAIAATPAAPDIAGSGFLLIDMDSSTILGERNADKPLEPASLTKIMTGYTIYREIREGNLALTDEVLISKKAWKTPGSRMFIEVDKKVSVDKLIKGMVIQSGNDASVALAEHIAGDEATFAKLMNENGKRLGMTSSHFVNATGLPHKEHYTTARDIAKVTAATIREFPEFYKLYSVKEYTYNKIKQHNRNRLLWRDKNIDGVKTGHTEAAGYCLVASGKRDGMRLISVIMGTKSDDERTRESQTLLNYGFRFFETHRLYGAGDKLTDTKIWKGAKPMLSLGIADDLYVSIPRNQYKKLSANTIVDAPLEAPVKSGQQFGTVRIELEGKLIEERPLIALSDVARGGFIDVVVDSALLLFK